MEELRHYGIKGMKWGVRRYRNADGSLTEKGKKKISKQYEKTSKKVTKKLSKSYSSMQLNSYNKAAQYMNSGGIDKFNKAQQKKYGDKFAFRKGYEADYEKLFQSKLDQYMNESLMDFYKNDKNFKKAESLVSEYKMESWNELAKNNSKVIADLRKMVERYGK